MDNPGTNSAVDVRLRRRLLSAGASVLFYVVAIVAAWLLWPTSLGGCTTLTIVSGHSMEPTYHTGDIVVSRCGSPAVGDIVVYQPKGFGGARIIHRIIGGSGATGWEMKGDNNSFVDPFSPADAEVLGRAVVMVPKVGLVASALMKPMLWVSLIILAVAILAWPSGKSREEGEAAADAVKLDTPALDQDPVTPEPSIALAEHSAVPGRDETLGAEVELR